MPQSFASIQLHVVFSTKRREPWLTDDLIPHLYPLIGGIVRERKCVLMEIGGVADHIHVLVSLGREESISGLVREIKSGSSRWIHEQFADRQQFCWQAGYGAFSVGITNAEAVRTYIRGQAEHHRKQSFQEEFREFLTRHGLAWDERYVWD